MERLRNLREDNDLTQTALASILGCSQATYCRYETGELNVPVDILKKLSSFYGVSIDYMTGLTNDKRPYKRNEEIENEE